MYDSVVEHMFCFDNCIFTEIVKSEAYWEESIFSFFLNSESIRGLLSFYKNKLHLIKVCKFCDIKVVLL